MADLRISQLPVLTGALLQADDPLAVADLSASETKQITAKEFVQGAVALIDAGSIPGDKVNVTLTAGSVGTTELADKAVTAIKLADSSSAVIGAGLPVAGAYIGQIAVDSGTNQASIWDGTVWQPFQTGIVSITGGTVGPVTTNVTLVGTSASVLAQVDDATGAGQFLAGPATSGGAFSRRTIVTSDLPLATSATPGIAAVPVGEGLRVDGGVSGLEANLEIANDVTPSSANHVVTYDAKGLVTGGRVLQSSDLPIATAGSTGAIATGTEFSAAAGGVLRHFNQVAAGVATKVSYDAQGHITAALQLLSSDIPDLPATILTSGILPADRVGDDSITADKLADYSTAYIQDIAPPNTGNTIGQLWLNPLAQQIRMWDGNVWVPIGVGALSEQNLRFCGLFDASTGIITVLTTFGIDAGFVAGDVIPAASEQRTGVYFVCEVAGNGVAVTPYVTYDPGDWIVCLGVSQGWQRVDTLNSGGGGGGASTLDELTDVDVGTAQDNQVLTYNASSGNWINQDSYLPLLDQLQNVTVPSPTDGQVLTFDNGTSSWIAAAPFSPFLNNLQDVNVPAPIDGQVLTFSSSANEWISEAPSFSSLTVTAPITDTGTSAAPVIGISLATPLLEGAMSAADKAKLDGIAAGAQPGTVLTVTGGLGLVDVGTSTNPIIDVGAGVGIAVTANDVSVDRTATDTWYAPASHVGSGDTAHALVTQAVAGFMAPADKLKLDSSTASATGSTLMFRDANGDTAVNTISAAVFDIDALPALP